MSMVHLTVLREDAYLNGSVSVPVGMLRPDSKAVMFLTPNRFMVVPVSLYVDVADSEYEDGEHYLCLSMKRIADLDTHPDAEYGAYYPCVTPSRYA